MLSDGEDLQAELVREPGFLEEVAHAFLGTETGVEVGERDESKVHGHSNEDCAHKYSR